MLAVSGAHLSYLIITINLIVNKKMFGRKKTSIISIIIIILFMFLANMTPSIFRAGVMAIVPIIGNLIHKKQDVYTTMSLALIISLIINPYNILNIGMQLSYLATLSILLYYNIFVKYTINKNKSNKNINFLKKIRKYFIENIIVSISANILIFPIIMYKFNIIPVNFLISNLIVGPLLGFVIVIGIVIVLISLISLNISKFFAIFLNLILNFIIKIISYISKIKNITIITPYLINIIIIYMLIFIITFCIIKKIKLIRLVKIYKIKLLALICIYILVFNSIVFLNKYSNLSVYLIDIGQGDGILIKTPLGKNILIDGGGHYNKNEKGVGEKILIPYLLNRRVSKIDCMILTHFDIDHVGAAMEVMKKIKINTIIVRKTISNIE